MTIIIILIFISTIHDLFIPMMQVVKLSHYFFIEFNLSCLYFLIIEDMENGHRTYPQVNRLLMNSIQRMVIGQK